MTSPLEDVRADEIARYLAERQVRTYSLEQVAEMTGFSLRKLQIGCRRDTIEHTSPGKEHRMTLDQIALLVAAHRRGTTQGLGTSETDEMEDARQQSLRTAAKRRPSRTRQAAA